MTPDEPPATASPPTPPRGWADTLRAIGRDLSGLVSDRVDLLALELRRASRALAQIVALLISAVILGVTAWLSLWAGIVVALVDLARWHWAPALLAVLALNAVVAALAFARARTLLPLLLLPATQRHLRPTREGDAAAASASEPAATPATAAATPAARPSMGG